MPLSDNNAIKLQAYLRQLGWSEFNARFTASWFSDGHASSIGDPIDDNFSLLTLAVKEGNEKFVRWLLNDCGAEVNSADANGLTPLHVAAKYGHEGIARILLLEYGAKPMVLDLGCRFIPLHLAVTSGLEDGVKPERKKEVAKLLISFILLKYQSVEKPDFILENTDLSDYWDEKIRKIKFLKDNKTVGASKYTKNFISSIFSKKNNTLLYMSFFAFFDYVEKSNSEIQENQCEVGKLR